MVKDLRINEEIRARELRLVDSDGELLGIMSPREALNIAQERGLDLVEIAPLAKPPVCRLMDYGKYKFELSKKERDSRKRQKIVSVKEVKLRLNIEEHDFQVKARNALRFLQEGEKVKVTIMFRGREVSHADLGMALCTKLGNQLSAYGIVERQPRLEGHNMIMYLSPKHTQKEG